MDYSTFISTDLDQIKKVRSDLRVTAYGNGYLYLAIYGKCILGCVSHEVLEEIKKDEEVPLVIKQKFTSSSVDFTENVNKRLNLVEAWTLPVDLEVFDKTSLETFISTQDHILISKNRLPGGYLIKNRYDIDDTPIDESVVFDLAKYEKTMNRYVTQYQLFGIKDNIITKYLIPWYCKEAMEITEINMDTFIKVAYVLEIERAV